LWSKRRGAALVEFAIVSVLLFLLVLGIIEFGLLMKDYLTVNQAAREGARSASLGSPTSVIKDRVATTAHTIMIDQGLIELKTGDPGSDPASWTVLGDSGSFNDAATGDLIQVLVPYDHKMVTGGFFKWLGKVKLVSGKYYFTVNGDMIMSRM
jgi:hypothetical protein